MKFRRIKSSALNLLDVTIVLVGIFILLSALYKMYNKNIFMLFDKTEQSIITVSIESQDIEQSDFAVGDRVDIGNGEASGEIVAVKNLKQKHYTAINNELIYDYSDKNIGVMLEISAKTKINKSKVYVNSSMFIAPGMKTTINTDKLSNAECLVDDIRHE